MQRIAVISDVHGNRLALEAVLADIDAQDISSIVSLGDHVSGPFDPRGTAERFMALDIPCVRGNHDRWVAEGREEDWSVDAFARDQLDREQREWLGRLPLTDTIGDDIFLCHGIPSDDNMHWMDAVDDAGIQPKPVTHVERHAEGLDYPVLLCGHSHVPRILATEDGRLVVNPGSVGLPILIGSPHARYAVLEETWGRWSVNLRSIPYDWDASAAEARKAGFEAWAEAVTTGRVVPSAL